MVSITSNIGLTDIPHILNAREIQSVTEAEHTMEETYPSGPASSFAEALCRNSEIVWNKHSVSVCMPSAWGQQRA